MNTYRIGDVVVLSCGSLPMTVISVSGEDVSVAWMSSKGEAKCGAFPHAAVMPLKDYLASLDRDATEALGPKMALN